MTAVTVDRTAAGRPGTLTGTGTLIRFILRRDRVRLPVWVAALTFVTVSQATALPAIYASASARQARADVMASPAATALAGPGYGFEDYTFGAMLTNEVMGFVAIFVALMSLLLVVRHTRAEEAAGRAELVRATVVGRHAPLTAALVVVVLANVVIGALVTVGLGATGIASVDWGGSLLFGAALAAVGIVFAAVAAVTSQLTTHARAAGGTAGIVLGLAYALRAAGDIDRIAGGSGALSWLSPIGWAQHTAAYVDDRWWPLAIAVAVAAVLVVVAVALSTRRDLGAGFVAPRPGPAHASATLASPLGLAWRQQRAGVVGWSLALAVFGLGYGTLLAEVQGFVAELDVMTDFMADFLAAAGGQTLIDAFVGLLVSLFAVTVGAYCVLAVGKLASEESGGRTEPLLATGVSRSRWLASHVGIALVGSAVVVLVAAAGVGVTGGAALDDPGLVAEMLAAGLMYVPVLWLIVGLATALYGWWPRLAPLAWAIVVYAIAVGMLGGLLDLPDWVIRLSPFEMVPRLPAEDVSVAPLAGMTAAALALLAAGFAGFRRRDLTTT